MASSPAPISSSLVSIARVPLGRDRAVLAPLCLHCGNPVVCEAGGNSIKQDPRVSQRNLSGLPPYVAFGVILGLIAQDPCFLQTASSTRAKPDCRW